MAEKVVPAYLVTGAFPMKVASAARTKLESLGVSSSTLLTLQQAYELEQVMILQMIAFLRPDSVTGKAALRKLNDDFVTLSPDSEEPGTGHVFQI